MMGAGKSTVGRRLASLLGLRFVDADAEIERAAGRSVSEIFAVEGEAAFRAREREAVKALLGSDAVVALGGGAIVQDEVRRLLVGHGPVVHLRVSPERALARVGDADERPLLAGLTEGERLARLAELLRERAPAYATADLAVDTDALAADEVAARIAAHLGEVDGDVRQGRGG